MGNALTVSMPNETNSLQALSGASAPLWALLANERLTAEEAVQRIVTTPGLLAETRERLPQMEAQLAPASEVEIGAILAEWTLVFDPGARAESPSFWKPYQRTLADVPRPGIEGAMRAYERQPDGQHLPKPGPFRALAMAHLSPLFMAIGRARRALKAPAAPPPMDKGTAQERQAFLERLNLAKPMPPISAGAREYAAAGGDQESRSDEL